MILKLKFNKTVAFRIICCLYPAEIFIRGIKMNWPWLCECSYRPEYLDLEIKNQELIVYAARHGYLEVLKWLYSMGVSGYVIRWAAMGGHLKVVKWLYSMDADPEVIDDTAIRLAAMGGHLEVLKWMYSISADPGVMDCLTIKWTCAKKNMEIANWLQSIGHKL
jgi:hypothetical protein